MSVVPARLGGRRAQSRPQDGADRVVDAVVFDMDGVVTDTARAHFAAWAGTFEALLASRANSHSPEPFSEAEYHAFVDGLPRAAGVRGFLAARGMALPEGEDEDPPGHGSVQALAAAKNDRFTAWLDANVVPAFADARALVAALKARGVRTALFSASRNAARVLASARAGDLFEAVVDGVEAERLGLPGKPDPAAPIEAARRLGVPPARAALIEDAVEGVRAGRAGGFRMVIGLDRTRGDGGAHARALRDAGADVVLRDLAPAVALLTSGAPAREANTTRSRP